MMGEPTAFPARARRLAGVVGGLRTTQDHPLLKAARLDADDARRLRDAVNLYLFTTLSAHYSDRPIAMSPDLLSEQAALIGDLPNVTPNGLILPKLETYLAYNQVHAQVARIFEAAGLGPHVEAIHAPINIRLVSGTPDDAVDGRPRASTKDQSDIWAGEPAATVMVFLPVLGDTDKVGIHWVEPLEMPPEFRRPIAEFDDGRHLIRGGRAYDAEFNNGDILLSDPFLIHATRKRGPGLRISIDFRFIAREKTAEDADMPGTRGDNYLAYDVWRDIGRGRVLTTGVSLGPYTAPDEVTRNRYAADFEIHRLAG